MSARISYRRQNDPHLHQLVNELNLACDADDVPSIRRLLATTPLEKKDFTYAFANEHSVSVLRCLLEHGADADHIVSNERSLTLEHLKACAEFGYDVKSRGHLILQDYAHSREILDWILDQGAAINESDHKRFEGRRWAGDLENYSVKVLNIVAAKGDIELFDHLVARGADPHRSLALHSVSRCQDPQKAKAMVDCLIDKHGMDMEVDSKSLRKVVFMRDIGTPVHCAVHYHNLATLEQLLARGADPNSGIKYAVGNGLFTTYLPALTPLLAAGADAERALSQAVDTKNVNAAKICLAHGADPSEVIEEQRARTARVRARREAILNDQWGEWDPDGDDYDSFSSQDGEDTMNRRTEMRDFLRSLESAK